MSRLGLTALAALALASPAVAEVQDKPWLGIRYAQGAVGARVTSVFEESGALASGLRAGDEIFEVDGQPIDLRIGLAPHIEPRSIGEKVFLRIYRDGQVLTLGAVLSRRLSDSELLHTQLVGKRARAFSLLPPVQTDQEAESAVRLDDSVLRGKVGVLAWFHLGCAECPALVNKVDAWVDAHDDESIVALAGVGGPPGNDDPAIAKALFLTNTRSPILVPVGVDQGAYEDYAGLERPNETLALVVVDQRGYVRMAAAIDARDDGGLDDVYAAAEGLMKRRSPRR
jgi:hypothetical protein